VDFHQKAFAWDESERWLNEPPAIRNIMSAASVASKSMNLGVSCLARAQNIQHQAARLNQDSEVMLPEWLDLAHRVAPALILKARECLTTALSIMAEKNGTIVNLELSCRLNLAFLAFGKGDENEALCHLCQYLDSLVELGRGTCAGCGQERHQDTPMLTCSGCCVAR
jgi:hypothetical protein